MSDPNSPASPEPTGSEPTTEPTTELGAPPAADAPAPVRRSRRRWIIGGLAAALVAVLGGGAWAVWNVLSGGGPQPEDALPASTVALVSIDLDPSAGQKIEAISTLRKFPALKDRLGLNTQDDLRKFLFDKALDTADGGTGTGACKDVTFEKSAEPWMGERVGIALVDLGDEGPVPAVALAIDDADAATTGMRTILDCAGADDEVAFVTGEDYLIASDTEEHAKAVLDAGMKKPLADDKAYTDATDAVGDRGVVNFYVAKSAGKLFLDAVGGELDGLLPPGLGLDESLGGGSLDGFDGELGGGLEGGLGEQAPPSAARQAEECGEDPFDALTDELDNFKGLAGTVRFADGGFELSVVGSGLPGTANAGDEIASLPGDTALVLGFAFPEDYAEDFVEGFDYGACEAGAEGLIEELEAESGLKFPEDVQTLLGSALTLTVGGDVPADLEQIEDPSDLPVGLVVHGDGPRIRELIGTLEERFDFSLADAGINVEASDDRVVISPSTSYADELVERGDLGEQERFLDAVPEADTASGVLYLDFESSLRDALVQLIEGEGGSEAGAVAENTDPLRSLGLSTWADDEGTHFLLKITTD